MSKELSWNRESVAVCNCGRPMLPLPSTWEDLDGCGWVCVDASCGDFGGDEIYADALEAVGVPDWVAAAIERLLEHYRN